MRKPNKDIQLTTYQDLLGVEENTGAGTEKVVIAPLIELFDFKDHPFKVLDDEKMEETTESIRQHGVLVPGIARPRTGGGYELIAGHRRKRGSERAGKSEMPIIVRNYTDDEATIIMVDSNIQREDILSSESEYFAISRASQNIFANSDNFAFECCAVNLNVAYFVHGNVAFEFNGHEVSVDADDFAFIFGHCTPSNFSPFIMEL